MNIELVSFGISLLMGVAAFLLFRLAFFPEEALEGAHGVSGVSDRHETKSPFLKMFMPLIISLGQLVSTVPMKARRKKLEARLKEAGKPAGLSADEFNATRFIAMGIGLLAGMYIDTELETSPIIALAFVCLGFVYPSIKLSGIITRRKSRIFRDLPDTLDTLRLAMDAGLDFGSAMGVVVEKGRKGPLLDELELVERDIFLGKTRQESLRAFAERLSMTEINAFVIALIQADQLGASIAPILKVQGDMARKRRWQYAEQVVNKLPMKMLGPLVVLIFPASFIILFTPLIIQYMQGGE